MSPIPTSSFNTRDDVSNLIRDDEAFYNELMRDTDGALSSRNLTLNPTDSLALYESIKLVEGMSWKQVVAPPSVAKTTPDIVPWTINLQNP